MNRIEAQNAMREKLWRMDYAQKTERSYIGWFNLYMDFLCQIKALRSRRMARKRVSPSVAQVLAILNEVRPSSGYPVPLVS